MLDPPLVPWKSIVFSAIKPLDPLWNCKISWGQNNDVQAFFSSPGLDLPDRNSRIHASLKKTWKECMVQMIYDTSVFRKVRYRDNIPFIFNESFLYVFFIINPWSANHTKSRLLSLLLKCLKASITNSVDPDQTIGAVWSGSTLFASMLIFVSNVRQLFAADDFSRRYFQMHFLGASRVKCNSLKRSTRFLVVTIWISRAQFHQVLIFL